MQSKMKSWGSSALAGHTRRLFLINPDVRKNKQNTDPANHALFYLILRRGKGADGVWRVWGQGVEPMPHLCWGVKINMSRTRAGLFGQEARSNF